MGIVVGKGINRGSNRKCDAVSSTNHFMQVLDVIDGLLEHSDLAHPFSSLKMKHTKSLIKSWVPKNYLVFKWNRFSQTNKCLIYSMNPASFTSVSLCNNLRGFLTMGHVFVSRFLFLPFPV